MRLRIILYVIVLLLCLAVAYFWYQSTQINFEFEITHKDNVESNIAISADQFDLSFIDSEGAPCDTASFRGSKNVLLIFMRGYPGEICINCSSQTSRLIKNYPEFVKRETEILVVFPGPKEYLSKFLEAGRAKANNAPVPFRVLLDPDYKAVDKLGIRGSLAKPSTYLIDKKGQLCFAYVGAYTGDRPSIKAMLDHIDRLKH
jgi:peroxiredoxin